jgi:hypothetical protein
VTKHGNRKAKVTAYAAEHGLTYQQALQAITPAAPAPEPVQPPRAVLLPVDVDELVRLVLADKAAAGITITEERARQDVAFTLSLLRRYLISEPLPALPKVNDTRSSRPHCSHENCAMTVCQDGYAWHACRKLGCPVCGGPPNNTAEHWAGDVVAYAVMTPADLVRAEAHLKAYPLLRRPNDPPTIPDERAYAAYDDPRDDYDQYDDALLTAHDFGDPDMDNPNLVDYFSYERD